MRDSKKFCKSAPANGDIVLDNGYSYTVDLYLSMNKTYLDLEIVDILGSKKEGDVGDYVIQLESGKEVIVPPEVYEKVSELLPAERIINIDVTTINVLSEGGNVKVLGTNDFSKVRFIKIDGEKLEVAQTYPLEAGSHYVEVEFMDDKIPANAFNDIDSTDISIAETVTEIGDGAFINVENITVLGRTPATLGEGVFEGTEKIVVPPATEDTYKEAWSDYADIITDETISGIVVANSPANLLNGTTNVKEVWIDGEKQDLILNQYDLSTGEHTFNIVLKNKSITGSGTFGNSVTNIRIPDNITRIEAGCFYACINLNNTVIPNSVTYIGSSAFRSNSITEIIIPDSVTEIENTYPFICPNVTDIVIGNGIETIQAFSTPSSPLTKLVNLTLGNSITTITNGAFYNCTSLTSVTIPNSVTTIENGAFSGCTGLTSITIPNSVTSIGSMAFTNCSNLTSINIGSGVTSIDNNAFAGCIGLTNIVVESGNNTYDSRDNCNAIIETATNKLIVGCQNTTIPNTVTSIGNYAFSGCTGLTSITIPNSVTSIGNNAFSNCISLTSITSLATTAPTIGNITFESVKGNGTLYVPTGSTGYDTWMQNANYYLGKYNWTKIDSKHIIYKASAKLTETRIADKDGLHTNAFNTTIKSHTFENGVGTIEFNANVTSIGEMAFNGCSGLTSVTIPDSVTSIGGDAFNSCGLTSITIPNSVTSISSYAFDTCRNLENVIIGNGVTLIGMCAFQHCESLTSITIPNNVITIDDEVFFDCENLENIIIGSGVTSIGNSVFYGCTSLTSITSLATTAPTIKSDTFNEINTGGTLYVPTGSIGYDTWMGTGSYYLGKYNWTKVEQ